MDYHARFRVCNSFPISTYHQSFCDTEISSDNKYLHGDDTNRDNLLSRVVNTWTLDPFTLGLLPGDISHDGCDFASNAAPCRNVYALKIINTNDIIVAGAGI
jgi:hypothetical protein